MRPRVAIVGSSLLLLALACASPPPPRESADLAVIGTSIRIKRIIGSTRAQHAFFVRLDEEDESLRGQPIRSNYARDGYLYLFNAKPGLYAIITGGYTVQVSSGPAMTPVGGGFSVGVGMSMSNTVNIYLPKVAMEKTAVTVGPGEWAFMGDILLDATDWETADEVQRHYYGVLAPGYADMNVLQKAFSGYGAHNAGTAPELDQGGESLASFLETSRAFAGEEWADALQAPVAAGPSER